MLSCVKTASKTQAFQCSSTSFCSKNVELGLIVLSPIQNHYRVVLEMNLTHLQIT